MILVEILPTTTRHVQELAHNLREADCREIEAFGGIPHRVLWRSWKNSLITRTVTVDGEVAAIFGVGGALLGVKGEPWLLTGPASEKVSPLRFTRIYQKEFIKMAKLFPYLANFVHSSYDQSVRMLENIGFELGEPEMYGSQGALFRKFEYRGVDA